MAFQIHSMPQLSDSKLPESQLESTPMSTDSQRDNHPLDDEDHSEGPLGTTSKLTFEAPALTEEDQTDGLLLSQVAQVMRAIPLLLLFHGSATISIYNVSQQCTANFVCGNWHILSLAVGTVFTSLYLARSIGPLRHKPRLTLRLLELACLGLGIVWALPAATFASNHTTYPILPVIGVSLAAMGVVAITMRRIPIGAIVFTALMTGALARAAYSTAKDFQFIGALLCVIYGLVLVGSTINSHIEFLRRARAESKVRHQRQVIKLLLNDFENGTSDWLWETNASGNLSYYSPRLAQVLDRTNEGIMGQSFVDLLKPYLSPTETSQLRSTLTGTEGEFTKLLSLQKHGRSLKWELVAHDLRDKQGRLLGVRGVGRDVTEKHEAQMRIEAAMQASESANSAKSQFLAVMSHELRTPINAIVGFSELLAKDQGNDLSPAKRREYCETILESSTHLQLLINDLLDATRIERGSLKLSEQENDAGELVEVAIKLCREQATKAGINIVGRLNEYIGLNADVTRIKQVIINLLTNAIKFSPEGGVVNVEMHRSSRDELVLSIRDAGIGIPADQIEHLFEPFVQAEGSATRRFGGMGLGLAIARKIARLHDGDVKLESAPGAGTAALLILPASRVTWPATTKETRQNVA